jgi:hypothetical protein
MDLSDRWDSSGRTARDNYLTCYPAAAALLYPPPIPLRPPECVVASPDAPGGPTAKVGQPPAVESCSGPGRFQNAPVRGSYVKASARWPHMGCPMPSHKFQVGETVYVKSAISRNVPGGAYEVTKQLPHNGREFEYRVKSASEEHERVMRESELTKA